MIACSEGLAFGEKLGMDPKKLQEILSTTTASCFSMKQGNPVPGNIPTSPASNNYEGGFSVGKLRKDVSLALECADRNDQNLKFTEKSINYYR